MSSQPLMNSQHVERPLPRHFCISACERPLDRLYRIFNEEESHSYDEEERSSESYDSAFPGLDPRTGQVRGELNYGDAISMPPVQRRKVDQIEERVCAEVEDLYLLAHQEAARAYVRRCCTTLPNCFHRVEHEQRRERIKELLKNGERRMEMVHISHRRRTEQNNSDGVIQAPWRENYR